MSEKLLFCNILEAKLDENLICEKQSHKIYPPNTEIFDVFEILKLV
jgi:uracil DNA glycosylase